MNTALSPPVEPMLGRLVREIPAGDSYVFEPKWDGFRCLAFRHRDAVDLRSRNDRPLSRYFPEIAETLLSLPAERFVLDGEIVVLSGGTADFSALLARLHPAPSRVARLRQETPATLIAFDLLAAGGDDLTGEPFAARRARLEDLLAGIPEENGSAPSHAVARGEALPAALRLTPATSDRTRAVAWLEGGTATAMDGVMAKRRDEPYRPGARAMLKVKRERTMECVVAGFRWYDDRPTLSSLLLGLYDRSGKLQHIGVASQFPEARRAELLADLAPLAVPLEGHPWERGFLVDGSPMGRLKGAAGRWSPEEMALDWVPLEPERVCEVAYEHLDRDRLRHPARLRRWRPDRDPRSCTFEQLGG